MNISLFTLTSPIHDKEKLDRESQSFLDEIAQASGCTFDICGENFDLYANAQMPVIYVRTGGTEGIFKKNFDKINGTIRLLTSGKSNSLAASMEILSYLRQHGRKGEILHGGSAYIAQRLKIAHIVDSAQHKLNGITLGVIGEPSDWLISSDANREALLNKLGIKLVDVTIDELVKEYNSIDTASEEWKNLMAGEVVADFDSQAPSKLVQYREGAFKIYLALEHIVDRYSLQGFTLRCFDLLSAVGNTGCMALAMFNSRGIPACCEGDVPALLTMTVGNALCGQAGFQANPSRIDVEKGEMTFAHCTVPFNMIGRHCFDTHFESGIGIAIRGELPLGPVTIAKLSGDLSRWYVNEATVVRNLAENDLCRTQIVLEGQGFAEYFFNDPIGNHHVIFTGQQAALFNAFMQEI